MKTFTLFFFRDTFYPEVDMPVMHLKKKIYKIYKKIKMGRFFANGPSDI